MPPLAGNAAGLAFVPVRRTAGFNTTNGLLGATAHTDWNPSAQRVAVNPPRLTLKAFQKRPPEPYIPQQPHVPPPSGGSVQQGLSDATSIGSLDQLCRGVR